MSLYILDSDTLACPAPGIVWLTLKPQRSHSHEVSVLLRELENEAWKSAFLMPGHHSFFFVFIFPGKDKCFFNYYLVS